ncbi:hypothetical protein K1719_045947 [Acacia pycnantha]|nr:hypothetical protein K1719_045947 [Acacia pycnantha]
MSISDLLKYGIGLGILECKDTVEDARNRLYSIIHELKAFCLLLEDDASEIDVTKMHYLVREVAVSIAQKNEHVFVLKRNGEMQDWLSKGSLQRCTQIILKPCFLHELPSKLDCPNLKIFHLQCTENCTLKIPDFFFEGMGSLEALDLTGLIISSLPQSLVSLSKLKTLCLDQCRLEHLIGIGSLTNLEIISFIYSSMKEFPSEIEQLAHLRMLDLSDSGIGIMPPNILSKLTKIEELYMGNASIKWEEESSAMQNMKSKSVIELRRLTNLEIHIREAWISSMDMMFDKLERYKIVIGDKWDWSSNKGTSKLLKLKLGTSLHRKLGIKALIKRVEELYLDEVDGISDVLLDLEGKGFPQLKHLHIQNNGQVQHIINTTERNETQVLFPELETLVLHSLNNLEKICHGPLPINSFCKLTIIKVENCDQLVSFSGLETLKLSSVNLEKIWDDGDLCAANCFHNLANLTVEDCRSLKHLFSSSVVGSLLKLKHLEISKCEMMEEIIAPKGINITTSEEVRLSKLETMVVKDMKSLKKVWRFQFEGLKSLELICKEVFQIDPILEDLDYLYVAQCPNLKHLVPSSVTFSHLTYLKVRNCNRLIHLITSSTARSLVRLTAMKISDCNSLEKVVAEEKEGPEDEIAFSSLEILKLESLPKIKGFAPAIAP